MKHIFAATVFLLLLPLSSAQTILPAVETEFTILSIVISPVPPDQGGGSDDPLRDRRGDFTRTSQTIALQGNLNYLSVRWNARYFDHSERDIGVRCYLNCPDAGDNIDKNCVSSQKCEYLGLVGRRSCVIPDPKYEFKPSENTVTCKFYDPANANLEFRPYPTRTFKPIDYSLSIASIAVTVGKPFNFPLSVIPTGLIPSAYLFSMAEITQPNALFIDRTTGNTEMLGYGTPGRFTPKITFLVAKTTNIEVLANANSDPVSCNSDSQCSYLGNGKCVNSKCWKKVDLQLKAGNASLPDFDIFGFLQIMMISAVVLFLVRRR